jgi:glycosyltransferase involved in cell wall biosynthesis
MERIKVLHLITHLGAGGALDNTLLTVKGLPRDRYEVHLAAGVLSGSDYTEWKTRAERCADALFVFQDLQRPVHVLKDRRALNQLTSLIVKQNYDIVHTHCAKAGVLGRIAAKRAGTPIMIHTFHSFGWQVAHDFHKSRLHKYLSSLQKRCYIGVERYAAGLADALITVSELNKREALALKIAPSEKFITIYSGVDIEGLLASSAERDAICKKFKLHSTYPVVGMIGRLSTQKAPLDFVHAAKIVLERKPGVQFILVGDGPLAAVVREAIGPEMRIKMLGFQDNVPEILSIINVFALPSLWEGLGRALTEAMIMGVPVVATSVNGVPELIVDQETGLLSPPANPAKLAENIIWLLDHPQEAQRMSHSASERVVPDFSAARMLKQIDALYQRLLRATSRHALYWEDDYVMAEKSGVT